MVAQYPQRTSAGVSAQVICLPQTWQKLSEKAWRTMRFLHAAFLRTGKALDPSDLPILQHDLNTAWMCWTVGENPLHDAACEFTCRLVCFEYDIYWHTWVNGRPFGTGWFRDFICHRIVAADTPCFSYGEEQRPSSRTMQPNNFGCVPIVLSVCSSRRL